MLFLVAARSLTQARPGTRDRKSLEFVQPAARSAAKHEGMSMKVLSIRAERLLAAAFAAEAIGFYEMSDRFQSEAAEHMLAAAAAHGIQLPPGDREELIRAYRGTSH